MNRPRYEDESYEDYRKELYWWEKGVRLYSRGRSIWDGSKGEYRKYRDGVIGQVRFKK